MGFCLHQAQQQLLQRCLPVYVVHDAHPRERHRVQQGHEHAGAAFFRHAPPLAGKGAQGVVFALTCRHEHQGAQFVVDLAQQLQALGLRGRLVLVRDGRDIAPGGQGEEVARDLLLTGPVGLVPGKLDGPANGASRRVDGGGGALLPNAGSAEHAADHIVRPGVQRERAAAGADRRQQLIRRLRQQKQQAAFGRLLEGLQEGVLRLLLHLLGLADDDSAPPALKAVERQTPAELADIADRDDRLRFVFQLLGGDRLPDAELNEIRMGTGRQLHAGFADAAGA